MRLAVSAACLLAAVTTTAAAQGFPQPSGFAVEDPVLRRIWAIGNDSSQLPHLAQVLFDSLGPRLTASPGMNAAQMVPRTERDAVLACVAPTARAEDQMVIVEIPDARGPFDTPMSGRIYVARWRVLRIRSLRRRVRCPVS